MTRYIVYLLISCCYFFVACSEKGLSDDKNKNFTSKSEVSLNSMFQSDMVLQQLSDIPISGKGTPFQKIKITCSWDKSAPGKEVRVNPDGTWKETIRTPAAGGPYTISFMGKAETVLSNVMIGEVWLCSGQSNMQWTLFDSRNGPDEMKMATNPNIRLLNVRDRVQSDNPVENITAKWEVCSSTTAADFSAIGYFFANKLTTDLNIPIGIINVSWGNTPAEVWCKRELVYADPVLSEDARKKEAAGSTEPFKAGNVYNAMIYPLRNFPIAGAIWYQGENNLDQPYHYAKLLKTMIEGWREDWRNQFPFYIAQICPYKRDWNFQTNYANPSMRFVQATVSETIPKSGVVVNDDLADINNIHPLDKKDVGMRLAMLALSKTYKKENYKSKQSPVFKDFKVTNNKLTVNFKYAEEGLKTSDGLSPTQFEIAGSDRIFHPATAVINGGTVELSSIHVPNPLDARMGWSYIKVSNLRKGDLPVSVFKTYTWEDPIEEPK
ncbi:sialate O-acetylesterase [Pedobacter sp. ASV1-7]|uniref:sialate O-acetylesterase n=1 Tax=Pedobacter sp. ASV1-7 TaxID=3145237 RepID=UPI0032E9345E